MNDYAIETASSADEAAILDLLTAINLPHDGATEYLAGFLVARDASGQAVACGGLHRHGNIGLLRSFAVAAYITAAYWFTASTSFANPAVAIARSLNDTFAGIRPGDEGNRT